MSDLACWRIGEFPEECFVVRIHGSEHSLNAIELAELAAIIKKIDNGAAESLGAGYCELQEDREAQARSTKELVGVSLLTKLGLKRSVPALKRRPL